MHVAKTTRVSFDIRDTTQMLLTGALCKQRRRRKGCVGYMSSVRYIHFQGISQFVGYASMECKTDLASMGQR